MRQETAAPQDFDLANDCLGSKLGRAATSPSNVRFARKPLIRHPYSITSSARASEESYGRT